MEIKELDYLELNDLPINHRDRSAGLYFGKSKQTRTKSS